MNLSTANSKLFEMITGWTTLEDKILVKTKGTEIIVKRVIHVFNTPLHVFFGL